MQNKFELKGPDIEDLIDIVLDSIRQYKDPFAEVRSMKVRFDIHADYSDGFSEPALKTGVQEIIYTIMNEKGDFYDFLSYVVKKYTMNDEKFDSLLRKYGYSVEDNGGTNIIVPLTGEIIQKEIAGLQGYIENNAPEKTLSHLKEAKEKFATNDFDGCLAECRLAIESLTKNGNFSRGITELATLNLISDNNDNNRKDDGWLLRSVWGYNSTTGSHSGANSPSVSSEQAFMGLVMTQSAIQFLLKKIDEMRQRGIHSNDWEI